MSNLEYGDKTIAQYLKAKELLPKNAAPTPFGSVAQELSEIRKILPSLSPGAGLYNFRQIANGPVEQVLAFNNNETIRLVQDPNAPDHPHFSSGGILTDLQHNDIPGSEVRTTFPVNKKDFALTGLWPGVQRKPFNEPPVEEHNAEVKGYSKQYYSFNCGRDFFVTVGPSIPKITKLHGGGAQFWVGSIGVMTQGHGKFEGARGVSVYVGSAFLEEWPDDVGAQIQKLAAGFPARIGTYFKYVPASSVVL